MNDGGPAFPQVAEQRYEDPVHGVIKASDIYGEPHAGMSLRQWYAARAPNDELTIPETMGDLAAALGISADELKSDHERYWLKLVSAKRFAWADAMLAQGEQKLAKKEEG